MGTFDDAKEALVMSLLNYNLIARENFYNCRTGVFLSKVFTRIRRTNRLSIGSSHLPACCWRLHHPSASQQTDLYSSSAPKTAPRQHMPCQILSMLDAYPVSRRFPLNQ